MVAHTSSWLNDAARLHPLLILFSFGEFVIHWSVRGGYQGGEFEVLLQGLDV